MRVLVTGATGGIGAALVASLTSRGATVIATGRRADALAALGTNPLVRTVVCDLADRAALEDLAAAIEVMVFPKTMLQFGELLTPDAVVGHSLGAALGYWLATSEPDLIGGLVALDGCPFLPALGAPETTVASFAPEARARHAELIAAFRRHPEWGVVPLLSVRTAPNDHLRAVEPRVRPLPGRERSGVSLDEGGLSAHWSTQLPSGGRLVIRFAPTSLLRQTLPWWNYRQAQSPA